MEIRDIHNLMKQFFSDGFTEESLSKATGVSYDIITRCANDETLSQNDIAKMGTLLDFLVSLYMVNIDVPEYLKECTVAMEQYFSLPHIAIANYLGLTEQELDNFLESPANYVDGYSLSMKLMHLRTILLQHQKTE